MTPEFLTAEKTFLHSYLVLRRWIGIIGMALPVFLVVATWVRGRALLSSISGYYYSDLRDVFVGCMCATGVFLIFYKGTDKTDNRWSTVAGIMAISLALCPTRPAANPTQWAKFVGDAHIVFSAVFFLILAVFCLFRFTRSDRGAPPDPQRKRLRNGIYIGCGALILVSLLLIVVFGAVWENQSRSWHPALWFEALAIFAFGVAWLIKGRTLFRDRTTGQPVLILDEQSPLVTLPAEPTQRSNTLTISDVVTFPVSIYLGEESGHEAIEVALETLLGVAGFDVIEREEAVPGSWFRRMRARMRDAARSSLAKETAAAAVHALESRGVLAHDAYYTATLLQNVGPLLTSLQSTKDAVVRAGALLIIKVEWMVAIHQLTSDQQLRLDHQPYLLTSPGAILHALDPSSDLTTSATKPASSALLREESERLDLAGEPRRIAGKPDNTKA